MPRILVVFLCVVVPSFQSSAPPDSAVLKAILHFEDKCPRDSASLCLDMGLGEYKILASKCGILPELAALYESNEDISFRTKVIKGAGSLRKCRCSLPQRVLLKKAMGDTSLVLSLHASEAYANLRCSNASEILEEQLLSTVLTHRIAAVYGLELMGKGGVQGLLAGLGSPNASIVEFGDSLRSWHMWRQTGPEYILGPPDSPEEIRLGLKDAEEKEKTLHGIIHLAINRITGQKMDGDTLRIKSWLRKNRQDTMGGSKKLRRPNLESRD